MSTRTSWVVCMLIGMVSLAGVAKATPPSRFAVTGVLRSVDLEKQTVVVTSTPSKGEAREFVESVRPMTSITLNKQAATLGDLRPGMPVSMLIHAKGERYVVKLDASPAPTTQPVAAPAVHARVVFGTDDKTQQAEVDDWISQALTRAGSPVVGAYTGWLTLSDAEQQLYASMQGGRIIKGVAVLKDGKYAIEIVGAKIGAARHRLVLEPGETRVVQLTNYAGVGNVFVALRADANALARLITLEGTAIAQVDHNAIVDRTVYNMILEVVDGNDRLTRYAVRINDVSRQFVAKDKGAKPVIVTGTVESVGALRVITATRIELQRLPIKSIK